MKVIFNRNAWHAKLYRKVYGEYSFEQVNNLCPYFWKVNFALITFPLWLPWKVFNKEMSFSDSVFASIILIFLSASSVLMGASISLANMWVAKLAIFGSFFLFPAFVAAVSISNFSRDTIN